MYDEYMKDLPIDRYETFASFEMEEKKSYKQVLGEKRASVPR